MNALEQHEGPRAAWTPRVSRLVAAVTALAAVVIFSTVVVPASGAAAGDSGQPGTANSARNTTGPLKDVTVQGHSVSTAVYFDSTGRVDVTRKWDGYNNCVEQDGSQYSNAEVGNHSTLRLSVTTVSSGSCFLERSKMHWQITLLNSSGKRTNDTADVSLDQGAPPRVLDYTASCQGTTGNMKCKEIGIIGGIVAISF